nr:diguanylate cyclase [Actinomycetota bacterium]
GQLFYRIRDAVIVGEASSGRIVTWNDAAVEMFGYGADEAIGLHIEDLVPESLKEAHRVGLARYAEGGQRKLIDQSAPVELPALRKDGTEIWVEFSLTSASAEGLPGRYAMAIVRNITGRKALEVELRRARAELEQQARELGVMNELGNFLRSCATTERALEVISRMGPRLFPSGSGALYLFDTSHKVLEADCTWGPPPAGQASFAPEDCWALRRGRPHIVEEPDGGPRCAHVQAGPAGSVCVPMVNQDDTLGVFHLEAPADDQSTPTPFRLDLAVTLAEQLGLALSNLRLMARLRDESIRDPLTGLYNRRYLDETLNRGTRRANRNGLPLSVIAIDIDHFKAFNDSYGHDEGDVLLRKVADYLRDQVRAEDEACRQGGDEFLVILPHATLEQTALRADELRLGVRGLSLTSHDAAIREQAVTVSIGVASYPDHASNSTDLLRAADRALYQAKAQGRDRVDPAE